MAGQNYKARLSALTRYAPIFDWGRTYDKDALTSDLMAAVIVTIMLIPQSLAYALLAGLPAEMGLYASILPLVAYAIFGTSRALAVGPVARRQVQPLCQAPDFRLGQVAHREAGPGQARCDCLRLALSLPVAACHPGWCGIKHSASSRSVPAGSRS